MKNYGVNKAIYKILPPTHEKQCEMNGTDTILQEMMRVRFGWSVEKIGKANKCGENYRQYDKVRRALVATLGACFVKE